MMGPEAISARDHKARTTIPPPQGWDGRQQSVKSKAHHHGAGPWTYSSGCGDGHGLIRARQRDGRRPRVIELLERPTPGKPAVNSFPLTAGQRRLCL